MWPQLNCFRKICLFGSLCLWMIRSCWPYFASMKISFCHQIVQVLLKYLLRRWNNFICLNIEIKCFINVYRLMKTICIIIFHLQNKKKKTKTKIHYCFLWKSYTYTHSWSWDFFIFTIKFILNLIQTNFFFFWLNTNKCILECEQNCVYRNISPSQPLPKPKSV